MPAGVKKKFCRIAASSAVAALLIAASSQGASAKMFYLEWPRLESELGYTFQNDRNVTPTRSSSARNQHFSEGLSLISRGYLYHPSLLIFDVDLTPTWDQEIQDSNPGKSSSRQNFYLAYSFNGTLLQDKIITLQLRASNSRSTYSSTLSPTTTSENQVYGATLVYKSRFLPSRLSYMRSEQLQQGFITANEFGERMSLTSNHRSERSSTVITADYDTRRRESQGLEQNIQNSSLLLSNNLQVTEDRRVNLSTSATARSTKSLNQTTRSADLSAALGWQHTQSGDRLQINSNYSARYNGNWRDGELSETIPLSATLSVSHRLYDNLVTSLSGRGGYSRFEGGEETTYGGQLGFSYTRRIPWGNVSLNQGNSYQVTDRTSAQEFTDVPAEEQTLSDLTRSKLSNRNIEPASIRVFKSDMSREYLHPFEFTIQVFGPFVYIARVPQTDGIAEGEKVLVMYRYKSDPSATTAQTSHSFGAGLSLWSHLDLLYQYNISRQLFLGGTAPEYLNDGTSQAVSAQLRYTWSDTLANYTIDKNSTGSSTMRWNIKQNFRWNLRPNLSLDLGGDYGESKLLDSGNSNSAYGLTAAVKWLPYSNQQWQLLMSKRTSTTDLPSRYESSALGLFYIWRYAIWSLKADYSYGIDEQPLVGQKRILNRVNLMLTRKLN